MELLQLFSSQEIVGLSWQHLFVNALKEKYGLKIVTFDEFDKGDSLYLLEQIGRRIKDADIVLLDSIMTRGSITNYLFNTIPLSDLGIACSLIYYSINKSLFDLNKTSIGVRSFGEKSITSKLDLPSIANSLGVPVPNTIRLSDIWSAYIDFPVRVKPIYGSMGKDNFALKSRTIDGILLEIEDGLAKNGYVDFSDYILQEEYEPLSNIRSILRFLVCGKEVLHGVIYYTNSQSCNVNGAESLGVIPLINDYTPQNKIEAQLLNDYRNIDLAQIYSYAGKIGEHGIENGNPVLAVEFTVDKKTGRVGCIDVNTEFRTNMFYPFYTSKENFNKLLISEGIGKCVADSYMRQTKL